MKGETTRRQVATYLSLGAIILLAQILICFQGLGDQWTRGHNGFNGAAYHLAARNTLRWGDLFPVQYYTGRTPPGPEDYYTHHPLAMHLHNVVSLAIFGDSEAALRLVPAVHGVLAVLVLMLFVRRFYGPVVALLASAIYVALPTNTIYANMANHTSGCILWSLLAFWSYFSLREARAAKGHWRAHFFGLLGATLMATAWEWPAYYAAAFICLHWFFLAMRSRGQERWRELVLLGIYGLWVLCQFLGHFLLVRLVVGDLKELTGIIHTRLDVSWDRFAYTLRVVPPLMNTWPVLVLCGLWLVRTCVVRSRFELRDLAPLAFGVGGWIHFFVFRWSAIVHEYWLWTTLPFVAIACATLLLDARRWVEDRIGALVRMELWRGRVATGSSLAVFLALVPLLVRTVDLTPRGRAVGGSLWFTEPTRPGGIPTYDSGRRELRFADQVRRWTDRSTGVLLHEDIFRTVPESRFDTTLDREMLTVQMVEPAMVGPRLPGVTGWVLVAPLKSLSEKVKLELARRHPFRVFGDYVMVDLRSDTPGVEVWKLEEEPFNLSWWFFKSAFEPPATPVRDTFAEEALRRATRDVRDP